MNFFFQLICSFSYTVCKNCFGKSGWISLKINEFNIKRISNLLSHIIYSMLQSAPIYFIWVYSINGPVRRRLTIYFRVIPKCRWRYIVYNILLLYWWMAVYRTMIFLSGWKSAPLGFFSPLAIGHGAFTTRLYIIYTHTHTFIETVPLDIYPNTYTAVDAVAYSRQCGWLRVGWRTMSIRYRFPGQMKRENKRLHSEYIHYCNYFPRSHFVGTFAEPYRP